MPVGSKAGLEITVNGNQLIILGERKSKANPSRFKRVFELSDRIDSGHIHADFNHGELIIHLPKSEKAKPRQIVVTE